MNHFEDFWDQRVSFGRYQLAIGVAGLFGAIAGGSLLYLMNSIPFQIQKDYFLTDRQLNIILTSFQIGTFTGGLLIGNLLDMWGRALTFRLSITITLLFFGVLQFPFNVFTTAGLAFILGVYGALTVSGYNTLLSETFNSKTSKFWIVLLGTSVSIGRLLGAIAAAIFMAPYQVEFWKKTILTSAYFLLVTFFVYFFFLKESLKFLFSKRRYAEFRKTANNIHSINNVSAHQVSLEKITAQEIADLRSRRDQEEHRRAASSSLSVFQKKFVVQYFVVCTFFSTFFMLMSGHVLVLAKFVGIDAKSLWTNVFIISGELLGGFLCLWLIEKPWVDGKRLMVVGAVIVSIGFLSVGILDHSLLPIVMFVIRICLKCSLTGVTVYATEGFPTLLKGKAFGSAISCGGFVTAFFPTVFLYLYNVRGVLVLWMMSGLAVLGLALAGLAPSMREAKRRAQASP